MNDINNLAKLSGDALRKLQAEKFLNDATECLDKLGIDIRNKNGEYKSTLEVLSEIADKWNAMK